KPEAKKDGKVHIQTIVPNLNRTAEVVVAAVPADAVSQLGVGDTVRIDNESNGRWDCARLIPDTACQAACTDSIACKERCWTFRVHLASDVNRDKPEVHKLTFYKGDAFVMGDRDPEAQKACTVKADAKVVHVVDKFGVDVKFHFDSEELNFKAGDTLSPLAEGMGLHRARPELRRFMGFAQLILDLGDPAIYAQHTHSGEIVYGDGKKVDTHTVVLNSVGDINVPVNTGAAIGRCAGLLDWTKPVAEWGGRTVNQALVDTKVLQAIDVIPHFKDSKGKGVLFDPEDLSGSATAADKLPPQGVKVAYAQAMKRGKDGFEVPRLNPPLHKYAITKDATGGMSGSFFPYVKPEGQHGFWWPGQHVDFLVKQCKADVKAAKGSKADEDACDTKDHFDHGTLILSAMGRFLASRGKTFEFEPCMVTMSCKGDVRPAPKPRK
ncbi:MAG: hypothetical protein KC502_18765, partial [Myxococcales bacterium]|nr:hypothetical protein [Myxococcales bacterium]